MLFFKRIITAFISFLVLSIVFYFGALVIGGSIAGGIAGYKAPENAAQAGQETGEEFRNKYAGVIAISSVGLSVISAGILTFAFGGIIPWCRQKPEHIKNDAATIRFKNNR